MEKKNPRINEHSKINDRQQVEEQGDSWGLKVANAIWNTSVTA